MSRVGDFAPGLLEAASRVPKSDMRMIGLAIDAATQLIPPGETVDFVSHIGVYTEEDAFPAALILTNNFMLVVAALGWGGKNIQSVLIPYVQIRGVESDGKKVTHFVVSHDSGQLSLGKQRDVASLIVQELRERSMIARSDVAAPAAVVDPVDQLRKLAELKDAGVLSEAEFEAQKQKLLKQI